MALIGESSGKNPQGGTQVMPVSGLAFSSTTPLGANGVVSTGWMDNSGYVAIQLNIYSDQVGQYVLEFSNDKVTNVTSPVTVQYDVSFAGILARQGGLSPRATYVRITYTNGTTAQTTFQFSVSLLTTNVQPSVETLKDNVADSRLAEVIKNVQQAKDTTGVYDFVYRTGNSLNVHVDNLTDGTQKAIVSGSVAVSNPTPATDITTLAKDATITTLNTNIGGKADTAVTDATLSASEIALLKGILSRLSNPLNVVTNPSSTGGYPSKAVYQPSGNAGSLTLVASGVRKLGAINITNTSGSTISIVLYDKATVPVTSDTPAQMYAVPNGQTFAVELGDGLHFNNGIGIGGIVGTSLSNLLGGILGSAIAAGSVAVSYAYI